MNSNDETLPHTTPIDIPSSLSSAESPSTPNLGQEAYPPDYQNQPEDLATLPEPLVLDLTGQSNKPLIEMSDQELALWHSGLTELIFNPQTMKAHLRAATGDRKVAKGKKASKLSESQQRDLDEFSMEGES